MEHMNRDTSSPTAPETMPAITRGELLQRLGWFVRVRWVMATLGLALLLGGPYVLGVRFVALGGDSFGWALAVVGAIFGYNALFAVLVHKARRADPPPQAAAAYRLALAQIACDLAGVTLLVAFTGGIENLFLLLVLLPIVIATALLPPRTAYFVAALAAGLVNALAWTQYYGLLGRLGIMLPGGQAYSHLSLGGEFLLVLEYTVALTATIFVTAFVATSISARLRQRERQLEEAHRMLGAADEAKSFFMRKAGHEMRAPLAAIFNVLDAIEQLNLALPQGHERLVDRAKHRLKALMGLVDDLRHYSRLQAGQAPIARKRVNLAEVVSATVELFAPQAADARIALACKAQPAFVEGDEELLRELATNLVANAIQYTPAGGRVEVELADHESTVTLTVSDTGIGISSEAKPKLFSEFFRSPEAKAVFAEGTGLGLAISKRIVEMHGGEIQAQDRPGGGTMFKVTLPET